MSFNFKYIEKYDVSNIADKASKFSEELWDEWSFRQDKHGTHKHTKTVPIVWKDPLNMDTKVYTEDNKYWINYEPIKNDINNLQNLINDNLSNGKIESVLLIKLSKNTIIPLHRDSGRYLMSHNRIHIPIITNPDVTFQVSNDIKYLKAGELWEINNNQKLHGVKNQSNIDRVHMVIDWKPL